MPISISNQIYRFIFDNSMDAIFLTKPDGSIYMANKAACDMIGRSEDEIIRLGRSAVVDTTDDRLPKLLEERARQKQIMGELRFLRKDGSTFPGFLTSKLFMDENNQEFSVIIVRDLTSEKLREKQQLERINIDELTQVYNRRGFVERLNSIVHDEKINHFSLLMIDIDYFKRINDSFGHLKGDEILKRFAHEIKSKLRDQDFIGRFGGDEFIICLYETDIDQTKEIANRILNHFRQVSVQVNNHSEMITCSIGVKHYNKDVVNMDSILSDVDDNMYKAKERRNTIYFDF